MSVGNIHMRIPCLQPPLITLTTDFGLVDTYVGVMKGVIYSIAPNARLVDLTHDIAPQNILEASARLEAAIDYFPPGTIHVVVVDPGVGSDRTSCVVQTDRALFVAPDNGVLTMPLRRSPAIRAIRLTQKAQPYCLPNVSATFHGRDMFAPLAAHLANGLELEALGEEIAPDDLINLPLFLPESGQDANGFACLCLRILYADRFGNLITNLAQGYWEQWRNYIFQKEGAARPDARDAEVQIWVGGQTWKGIARTFADVAPGELLAYWGSSEKLEIGVRDGNAASMLQTSPGAAMTICI